MGPLRSSGTICFSMKSTTFISSFVDVAPWARVAPFALSARTRVIAASFFFHSCPGLARYCSSRVFT